MNRKRILMRKRILCLILMLAMLGSLVSCKTGTTMEDNNESITEEQPSVISEDGQWIGKGGCYKLDRIGEGDYYRIEGSSNNLIFADINRLAKEDGTSLCEGYVRDYVVADDGVWYVREKGMVGSEYIEDCYAAKLSFDGQELTRFDISVRADSIALASDTLYIYDAMDKVLEVYNVDGTKQGKIDLSTALLEDFSGRLLTGGDGSVWLFSDVQSGLMLYPVILSSMSLGNAYVLPENMISLRTGTQEHIFLMSSQEELSFFDPVSGTNTNILYWDECGMNNGELSNFIPDGDSFLCLSVTGLARISLAKPEEIHPKIRLTMGALSKYEGRQLAELFSAQSNDFYVETIDYSNGGALSRGDALMKLNTELISGTGPDMAILSDMSSFQNTSALVDLYSLLDEDTELDREDFYGLKAFETSDRLLIAPSSLTITTFGVLPKGGDNRTGWTWDEYFELESKLPEGGVMYSYLSADFFLLNSLNLYAPQAIDWVNGTCNFDTPEFVRILKAAKDGYDPKCPEENPYFSDEVNAMMPDGRMILNGAYFFDTMSFAESERMTGPLSYIGWPTPDGSCGSVFRMSGISICATTNHLDGCWEFAKYVLKSTYAYKPTFESAIDEATTPNINEDGESESMLTQSQADRYRKLMESISVAVPDSSEISDIVLREAAPMFAGSKTPEETAKLIQSILSIYVAEHAKPAAESK